jgi:hypothetical protein
MSTPVLLSRPSADNPPQTTLIKPQRSLAGIIADAVIEEISVDEKVITQHPVEQGSTISEHAFDKPAELSLVYVWSMSSDQNNDGEGLTFLRDIYEQLLNLKIQGEPFDVITGKRSYKNMLIEMLKVGTDKSSENILLVYITCKEVIIVTTQTVQLSDAASQAVPEKTSPDTQQGQVQLQPGDNFNATAPF